ncbi:PREDICTED: taste receptor type 2 member 4-like [Chrysochloris asiatica]|uniref:Taste receptor type 2 n=1 Tax=Chrysochloris asiatica TaxID=185453 RepID=A0A9B0WLR2_CHRAS|nr:PREDICTED: taste receptor type 2 member 4-like [Chrysochloris asiatica]
MSLTFFFSVIIASVVLNFVGLIVSLFIAVVNYKTWLARRSLSSSDKILSSLAVSRFLMLGLFLLNMTFFLIDLNVERSVSLSTFFLLSWMFLDSCNLWFVTLLNTLYCVKIANFQHSVFLLLKRHLSPKIPRLLLACVLTPALTTLLYIVLRQTLSLPDFGTKRRNGTVFDINTDILSLMVSFFLSSFPQFILNVTSASLLINSLQRHIQKMQRNATGFWNPQMEAHMGAMKLMIYFLVLYIPYSVSVLINYLPASVGTDLNTKAVCVLIYNVYFPGHSVLLILTHLRLKTKAKQILCCHK